MKRLMGILLEQ